MNRSKTVGGSLILVEMPDGAAELVPVELTTITRRGREYAVVTRDGRFHAERTATPCDLAAIQPRRRKAPCTGIPAPAAPLHNPASRKVSA